MEPDPLRLVPRLERPHGIEGHRCRRWHVGQRPAIRSPELERAVGQSLNLVALLVHRAVMATTEHREIRQRGRAARRPVTHVMSLPDQHPAAREAAAPVPMLERAPQRWRDRARAGPDLHESPVRVVPHHNPARVAG